MDEFKIIEFQSEYTESVKDLLVELQVYLSSLDSRGVLVLKSNYRDGYFNYVMDECCKHNGKIFLAIDDNNVVGVIVAKIFQGGGESDFTTSCPKIGFISDLVVAENSQCKGIGKMLIKQAEEYFYSNNCDYTQLEVFAPNQNAFELYKNLGFGINCYYLSKRTGEQ